MMTREHALEVLGKHRPDLANDLVVEYVQETEGKWEGLTDAELIAFFDSFEATVPSLKDPVKEFEREAFAAAEAEGLRYFYARFHVSLPAVTFVGTNWEEGGFTVNEMGNPLCDSIEGNSVSFFKVEELDRTNEDHVSQCRTWYDPDWSYESAPLFGPDHFAARTPYVPPSMNDRRAAAIDALARVLFEQFHVDAIMLTAEHKERDPETEPLEAAGLFENSSEGQMLCHSTGVEDELKAAIEKLFGGKS